MANEFAIQSVGETLRFFLQSAYPATLQTDFPCTFEVVSTSQLAAYSEPNAPGSHAVSLFLYRVTINEQLRSSWAPGQTRPGTSPGLPLDLHWMISVWSGSASAEHVIFAWLTRQLAEHAILDSSLLTEEANWGPADQVHVIPQELSVEDTMRIWDALQPGYRLSSTYIARGVRIDLEDNSAGPVLSSRLELSTATPEGA